MSLSGSPLISWVIWNQLGSSISTGQTFSVTSLYFFPMNMASGVLAPKMVYTVGFGCNFHWVSSRQVLERKSESKEGESESQSMKYATTMSVGLVSGTRVAHALMAAVCV